MKIPSEGEPYLEGLRCKSCRAVFLDSRRHCARCGARDALSPVRLSRSGRLHAFSIVHRSFPEVQVPYVSAIVDLDGGGALKGTLRGVAPAASSVRVGMEIEVAFGVVPERDEQGQSYIGYFFQPKGAVKS